jgi:hypothetical protein
MMMMHSCTSAGLDVSARIGIRIWLVKMAASNLFKACE